MGRLLPKFREEARNALHEDNIPGVAPAQVDGSKPVSAAVATFDRVRQGAGIAIVVGGCGAMHFASLKPVDTPRIYLFAYAWVVVILGLCYVIRSTTQAIPTKPNY